MDTTQSPPSKALSTAKVVVATTVALSFISYWRGAAIVLSDLASSMFYAGGIAELAIGKSAAWYILAVMIFSFAVRAVYTESCGMFVRGGVRSEEHTSELQSHVNLVCRLLLEKKNKK